MSIISKSDILFRNSVEKAIEEVNKTMHLDVKSNTLDAFFYGGSKKVIFVFAGIITCVAISAPFLKFLLRHKTNKTYSISETYIIPALKDLLIIAIYIALLFSPLLLL